MIPVADRRLVAAALDRMIPADAWPAATEAGVLEALDRDAGGDHATLWARTLGPGFAALAAEAEARHGVPFADLDPERQDALLAASERGETRTDWPLPAPSFLAALARAAAEAYYARRDGPGWRMIGYDAAPKRGPGVTPTLERLAAVPFGALPERVDVLILGAGAGGGAASLVLAEAGARVLLVDRGRSLTYHDVGRDHLRNHRLSAWGQNTAPDLDPGPRLYVDSTGTERIAKFPHQGHWYNNALIVGGGTRVYQGMAWRFLPDDFRLASKYGVPEGSTIIDWPITYDELEPWYDRAEQELGVCGDGRSHRVQGARTRDYPMPPLPDNPEAIILRRGAERLGWSTGPVPLLINSVPRHGRAQCVQCGECVGFACPSDAKNGSHNALIPRALATGRAHLAEGARALRVTTGPNGQVTGALLVDERTGAQHSVSAGHVIVSCGAIESARLLLASSSDTHPHGLGNATDQVGRNLQGHLYLGAYGAFDDEVIDGRGPGVSISTCDFNHDRYDGCFAGGSLHNDVIKLPIIHWIAALPPDLRRWGLSNKHAMRDLYRRTGFVYGPIQEVSFAESRVTLDPTLRDRHGVPVARLHGPLHPESRKVGLRHRATAEAWLAAAGATRTWVTDGWLGGRLGQELTAGQHQAGTCRMGDDPATSVTDRWGRIHGHDNLWVLDGGLHVSNGGFNPVLTIFALAFRGASRLAAGGYA